jgi:hypothetical protein
MDAMFRVTAICPDAECAEEFGAVGDLDQLEALACDCGCTLRIERIDLTDEAPADGAAFELVAVA